MWILRLMLTTVLCLGLFACKKKEEASTPEKVEEMLSEEDLNLLDEPELENVEDLQLDDDSTKPSNLVDTLKDDGMAPTGKTSLADEDMPAAATPAPAPKKAASLQETKPVQVKNTVPVTPPAPVAKKAIAQPPVKTAVTPTKPTYTSETPVKAVPKTVSTSSGNSIASPRNAGDYSLQVGIFNSQNQARVIEEKLQKLGYKPYISEIQDPKPSMPGTYYRVRLGYFNSIPEAKAFGEEKLSPSGVGFWVDRSSRDGNTSSFQSTPATTPRTTYTSPAAIENSHPSTPAAKKEAAIVKETVPVAPPAPKAEAPRAVPKEETVAPAVKETAKEATPAPAKPADEDWNSEDDWDKVQ